MDLTLACRYRIPLARRQPLVQGASVEQNLKQLRRYLQTPKTLAQIAERFGWSPRTCTRRLHAVGHVWRVWRVPPWPRCQYVANPTWDRG